ncbi:MAG: polysaccharide deacetylase family protein [Chloroflexota bacterium]
MLTRRDFLKLAGAGLLAAAAPGLIPASAQEGESAPLIYRGSSRHRYVNLSYDDCYLVKKLQELEKLLDQYPDFKITLFPVGLALLSNEGKDPGIWKRFYEKGHEIGYHSWDHTNFGVMSPEAALADYARWYDALAQVLGVMPTVRFGRPTYGSLAYSFDVVCRENNLVNTMWSTGWGGEPLDVVQYTVPKARNGDIILLHIRSDDVITSTGAYPWMRTHGWGAVTLSQLYDDLLMEQNQSTGCDAYSGPSLTRACIE